MGMRLEILRATIRMRALALMTAARKMPVLLIAALLVLIALVLVSLSLFGTTRTSTTPHVTAPPSSHASMPAPRHSPLISPTPSSPAPSPTPTLHHPVHSVPGHVKAIRHYVVRTGDSLWAIASHVYHNARAWPRLYHLNHFRIGSNPNLIHTGMVLRT